MAYKRMNLTASPEGRCDIKTWSGDCRQASYQFDGEKYLCTSCGILSHLDHEVDHQIFPYVSGDYDRLI
ncbi:MAG: hypothetical protein P4L44_14600 [Oryzomonas sp.]|uniref:hypothetical protein n=1 Tax=Oryzomonas sp. TaxID=2855186 RepID=UPI00285037D8|nr:hypothetical protein [Oryzomonas sp.]MDR3581188.1 hypothetical protein [Oryzomonas sp.]